MGAVTRFGGSQLLLSTFAPGLSAVPSTLWIALTLTVPLPEASGSDLVEPSGGDYQRMDYPKGEDYWTLEGLTTLVNSQPVTWPLPSLDWGRIQGWALTTSQSGGNVIASGALQAAAYVTTGSSVTLPANAMRIRLEF